MDIILNIATHGNETIGHAVVEKLKNIKLCKGRLRIQVANSLAYKMRKRFIDQDLNRSFPGNKRGNYEERIAANLYPIIKAADVVIDIHSTTSGLKDAVIVTKMNKKTLSCIKAIQPKYVLKMSVSKTSALISAAKIGIAFEYGSDTDVKAISNTVEGIKSILKHFNMIKTSARRVNRRKITMFDVTEIAKKKKGSKLKSSVRNYKKIRAGEVYAYDSKRDVVVAEKDFYPILFGEKNYKDYFGFISYKKLIIR